MRDLGVHTWQKRDVTVDLVVAWNDTRDRFDSVTVARSGFYLQFSHTGKTRWYRTTNHLCHSHKHTRVLAIKQKSCGARHNVVIIRSQLGLSASEPIQSHQSRRSVTLASSSTATLPWGLTSSPLSDHVLRYYVWSVACDVPYRLEPFWP